MMNDKSRKTSLEGIEGMVPVDKPGTAVASE